jgi:hypothetical protein
MIMLGTISALISLTHNRSHRSQYRATVVAEYFQIPRMFGTRTVLVARETISPDTRVNATGMNTDMTGAFLCYAPILGFHVMGCRFWGAEPHAHCVAGNPVECIEGHTAALSNRTFLLIIVMPCVTTSGETGSS